ncbi:nitroreductase [Formosa sp. PL04]|uniref:nitroreductase family protein n=1 Tax=Formosa sp. PL04 TaxID=3081755 RepID=UPI002981AEF5|nr:nitroreductase [Formosa sp. PL04]MDW5288619.1 nitroreductase [Formosa sp. PL04]
MELKDIIENRRSVFPDQYNSKPISKETIQQLLDASNWAPTHKRTEPWRFKVLHGESQADLGLFLAEKFKATTDKFSDFKYNKLKKNPKKAGAIIAICLARDPEESIPEWEEISATAMAVQNMWLTATSLGLGSYWSSPGLISNMNDFFNLKPNEKCLGFFYLGYFDEPSPKRKPSPIADKVEWL